MIQQKEVVINISGREKNRKSLDLYIPSSDSDVFGGPKTFLANLEQYLKSERVKTKASARIAKNIFFPIKFDTAILRRIHDRGGKVIQRLDGIWYPEKHGDAFRQINQPVMEIYRYMADFVVFQSVYSRRQVFELFGECEARNHKIIINGVNKTLFNADSSHEWKGERPLRLISTGRFRDKAMIEPVILALDSLAGYVDFELHIVGEIVNKDLIELLNRSYVVTHGDLKLAEVADLLRRSDIFIYSHLNPPCPNSVLEALSCGLPVVGFNSGAMSELLPFGKDLLAPVSAQTFQEYREFRWEALAEKIQFAIDNYQSVRKRALDHAHLHPFEDCGDAYLQVFQSVLGQATIPKNRRLRRLVNSQAMDKMLQLSRKVGFDRMSRALAIELLRRTSRGDFLSFMERVISARIDGSSPSDSLQTLFALDKKIYGHEGKEAIRYDNGIHTKHRHIQYHSFFMKNVKSTDRVLDLGCGKGELANSVASVVTEGSVCGLDRKESSIEFARSNFGNSANLSFILGDINDGLPGHEYDVVLLSNVLEHVEERVELLKKIQDLFAPRQVLVRVPLFQRDWRVPLQAEIGFDYRLDPEHFIEYTPESFENEISSAGYKIAHAEIRWGEIWAKIESET